MLFSCDSADLVTCEKCLKMVSAFELPEHIDYHYAKVIFRKIRVKFLNVHEIGTYLISIFNVDTFKYEDNLLSIN